MKVLDPFYGVFDTGKTIARILNRLLIVAELLAAVYLYWYLFVYEIYSPWWLLAVIPGTFLAIHVVNLVIRGIWNLVMVFIFGTTDAEDIIEKRERRQLRRQQRRERRQLHRQARRKESNSGHGVLKADSITMTGQDSEPEKPYSVRDSVERELKLMHNFD